MLQTSACTVPVMIIQALVCALSCNEHNSISNREKLRTEEATEYQLENYLMRSNNSVVNILDNNTIVHSITNNSGNMIIEAVADLICTEGNISNVTSNLTVLHFTIPGSIISWSYYIGVNKTGVQSYADAGSKFVDAVAPYSVNPVAALALGLFSYLAIVQSGENVRFWIVDELNKDLLMQKKNICIHRMWGYSK